MYNIGIYRDIDPSFAPGAARVWGAEITEISGKNPTAGVTTRKSWVYPLEIEENHGKIRGKCKDIHEHPPLVGGLEHVFFNFPQPDWGWWSNLTFIFFRGVGIPPTRWTSSKTESWGFSWEHFWGFPFCHGGTPNHHPFIDGFFPEKNNPAIGIPPCLRKGPC